MLQCRSGQLDRLWCLVVTDKTFGWNHKQKSHSLIWSELNGSVKEPNMFHNYETEKITRKASDVAENLQLYRVVRFFRPSLLCTTTHLLLFSERPPIYAS